MNPDFDNEFETDDELKRGRSRRKDGRKYASSGLTGRTGSTGRGSRTAAGAGKSRLRTIIIFIVVLMMHHLITIKNSTKMILHHNPVKQNIPILRSEGMLWY